ncbi:glycosyltransferase [Leptolyngbya sp. PCC 6406]|uniref:glycosyltransferase n=1 Tax=Leptolyngbya sp. PCC 6406 TaxID=1173264 RepID=UPI0002ABBAD2|nr:glycosyltransferase [Leptolyngbya sp. PCC 6406]
MASLIFLAERFPPDIGGVASSAGRIVAALAALDLQVIVLTWSRYLPPGELSPPESQCSGRVTVYRLGLYRHWDMTLPMAMNVLDWLLTVPNEKPLLLWGHYLFPAGFLAVYCAQLQGISSVVSARGNDVDRALFPPGDFARLQWTLNHATEITTVSRDLVRKIQILSDRAAHLHKNVVDVTLFRPQEDGTEGQSLRADLGIQSDEIVLGFSGELREKKGQQFLLEALRHVNSVRPACLLIIGELRSESQTLVQNFRGQFPEVGDRILVTGHLESPARVAQHLHLCDLYLQPSLWDGLPNALLEAMACGCLCIASDAGGMPDVITSGEQGFLLSRHQLHRLGEAILEVLALPTLEQERVKQAARSHICQSYSLVQEQIFLKGLLSQMF